MVIEPVESRHLVPFDGAFRLDGISTRPPDGVYLMAFDSRLYTIRSRRSGS